MMNSSEARGSVEGGAGQLALGLSASSEKDPPCQHDEPGTAPRRVFVGRGFFDGIGAPARVHHSAALLPKEKTRAPYAFGGRAWTITGTSYANPGGKLLLEAYACELVREGAWRGPSYGARRNRRRIGKCHGLCGQRAVEVMRAKRHRRGAKPAIWFPTGRRWVIGRRRTVFFYDALGPDVRVGILGHVRKACEGAPM